MGSSPKRRRSPGRVVVIGAGPTGLGAAWRFLERGHDEVVVLEAADRPGGLAASFVDEKGFTWDVGGHVQFSHYDYFDELMDGLLGDGWLEHERESWVWIQGVFVPYPFQYNIHRLPVETRDECLRGLLRKASNPSKRGPSNFREWILEQFGEGIARHFMLPYNFKTWACPTELMDFAWVGERVAAVDLERLVFNVLYERDDVSWGPNNTFRFPLEGGTGAIWRSLAARLPEDWLRLGTEVTGIDLDEKSLRLAGGEELSFDTLVSTMPLDRLVALSAASDLMPLASRLVHSAINVFGIGIEGRPPRHLAGKCWMYFPGESSPYFRATVFSNYSPRNVPSDGEYWSLMVEVSESPFKPVDERKLPDLVEKGLEATGLVGEGDRVVDRWFFRSEYGYPTPFLGRNAVIEPLLKSLEARDVYSRGRFGAWKYEVANQDHSLMQGVELVDRLLDGSDEPTLNDPSLVNGPRRVR